MTTPAIVLYFKSFVSGQNERPQAISAANPVPLFTSSKNGNGHFLPSPYRYHLGGKYLPLLSLLHEE